MSVKNDMISETIAVQDILMYLDERIAGKAMECCVQQNKQECWLCVCNAVSRGKGEWLTKYTANSPPPTTDEEERAFYAAWDAHCVKAANEFLKLPCTKTNVHPEDPRVH